MSNSPSSSSEQNNLSGSIQAIILFSVIALLMIVIMPNNGDSSIETKAQEARATASAEPNIVIEASLTEIPSPPKIDLSAMPIAMYTLQNPNGWDSPESVSLIGTFQQGLTCDEDWSVNCKESELHYEALSDIWRGSFNLPAGQYEYKAMLDKNSDLVYGRDGSSAENSLPITLDLDSEQTVNFYYDHKTGWITDDVNALIVSVVGNFQDEIGCTEEWQADCLRTWMQDVDGDGIYSYETVRIAGGSWQAKVAINASMDESYGADGELDGEAIQFDVPNIGHITVMAWNEMDKTLTVFVSNMPILPSEGLPPLAPNE
jgi:hypothetical protein